MPQYILWVIGGITGLLAAAAGMVLVLRQQVKVRTRHLEQSSAELQESEERYRTLARISPVGSFAPIQMALPPMLTRNGVRSPGYLLNEALGDGWLKAVHPDDRERLSKGWQESTQLHKASFSDYRFVRPDGTIAWVMGQAVPEMDSENQIVGYVGTITDITERKRAEAALQASERQLSLIYANISDVLFYLAVEPDDRFRFVSVNPAFLKATGLTEDQIVGKLVQEVIPEPAQALVLGNCKEAIRTKKTVGWQEVTASPAGEKHGEVSVTPILDANGNCTRLIGTVHDITERVRAETELRRLNAELEQRVARRTEELNAAMRQAQEADRLKSAFLATMSHELRTPLNSIIGFTGVLLQGLAGPLNAEQTKQLGMTRDSGRHLLALINDVLDISKIEAGQLEVARAPFEMRAAIEDTLRSVSPQAQKKGLALTAAIASNVGVVVSDRRRVEQILLNLLSNAIKFTERGEVQLECRVQEGWLETSVRDTGIGIRPEDLGKLFQPFHQLETGLNRRHEGTGLGLAICKNLVNLLGGQIRAESEWGAGSTFTFTLPLAPEGESHGEHPDHRRQRAKSVPGNLHSGKARPCGDGGARWRAGHQTGGRNPAGAHPAGHSTAGHGRLRGGRRIAPQPRAGAHAHRRRHLLRHGRRPGAHPRGGLQRLYRETHQSRYLPRGGASPIWRPTRPPWRTRIEVRMSAILIVDDLEQNRYLLRAMLTASGDEVLEAANGAEALELARRTRPDLIISDILMPQMDGFALCRECKRDEQLRDIPFVFYTATYTDPRDEALALQLGAARFIIKPVESEDFIAIVREVLQAHAAGQLAAPRPRWKKKRPSTGSTTKL